MESKGFYITPPSRTVEKQTCEEICRLSTLSFIVRVLVYLAISLMNTGNINYRAEREMKRYVTWDNIVTGSLMERVVLQLRCFMTNAGGKFTKLLYMKCCLRDYVYTYSLMKRGTYNGLV